MVKYGTSMGVEAPIVEAVGLRKSYDQQEVVCGVDFTVRPRECFTYYFTLVISVMYFFSRIFFPLASLPAWAQALAWCLPLTHAVALSRACVTGTLGPAALVHLGVLVGVLAATYALAVCWVGRRMIA